VPELPDVVVYVEALTARITGRVLERLTLLSPFVLRSVVPPIETIVGQTVRGIRRLGKRIVLVRVRRAGACRATARPARRTAGGWPTARSRAC
jgi:formamidopyrimidine-DNA glycosylase